MPRNTEKVVPLVVYINGERHIIGTAKLIPNKDGLGVSARITDKNFSKIFDTDLSSLSINGYSTDKNEPTIS
jgi:hypothetical protein